MVAAVYCRKSTDQSGVADDQKSVTRQIEHARAYAARKGWIVADEHVYVDDGISGAEFTNRPGFLRLMNALKPRPPFTVLVMSDLDRLGRESIETPYAVGQLIDAGVRLYTYLDDREITMESSTETFQMQTQAFVASVEREKARQRTYDALVRKARAGHVCGGRVFGYDNVDIAGANGKRSHVERCINETEAAVVRQIFELCAAGTGYTRIAKLLNTSHAPAPRAQADRPTGWAPSTVNDVLHRELYRGVVIWNRTRKRDRRGRRRQTVRPNADWMRQDVPALRIVDEAAWRAAHDRLNEIRAHLVSVSGGRIVRGHTAHATRAICSRGVRAAPSAAALCRP
jgi:site-specific DNA recombinase